MKLLIHAVIVLAAGGPAVAQVSKQRPDLSFVTANMKDLGSVPNEGDWHTRYANLAIQIAASGSPPDIISLDEVGGWETCTFSVTAQDYDAFDLLIYRLHMATGVQYRIAFFVGAPGSYGGIGGTNCHNFSGSAVLYNPARIINRTPTDAIGRGVAASDSTTLGLGIRRSMPVCSRGTNLEPIASLIDGTLTTEKCSTATPSGPAWTWMVHPSGVAPRAAAALGRFSFVSEPSSSFDVVTVHTVILDEAAEAGPIDSFIQSMSVFPFRTSARTIPTIVTGDYNALAGNLTWLGGLSRVFVVDVMTESQGEPTGAAMSRYPMTLVRSAILPADDPTCKGTPADGISDHCAFRTDYNFTNAASAPPPEAPYTAAPFWNGSTQLASPVVDWAPWEYKAECSNTGAVTGLSYFVEDQQASTALCRAEAATFAHASCHAVHIDVGENRGTTSTGDWDPGYYKGECAMNEYVAGVSQSVTQVPNRDDILSVDELLCCTGAVAHATCATRFIGNNERETTDSWSWSPGDDMAECGPGRYVAGVSLTSHGTPHAILCCDEASGAGGTDPVDPLCKGGVHNPSCK
jgi:hypothetical protein